MMGAGFGRRRVLGRRRRGPRGLRRTCSGRTPTASAFLSSGPVLARFVLTLANMSVSTGLTSRGSILSALGRRRGRRMGARCAADHSRLTLHPRSGAQSKSARRRLPCPCVAREFEICDSNPASAEKACAGGLVFSRGAPTLLEQEGVRAWARTEIARIGWRQHLPSAVPLRQGHDAAATCQIPSPGTRCRA